MAVAQKIGMPKWVALVSGHMDQNLRNPPPFNFEPHPFKPSVVSFKGTGLIPTIFDLSHQQLLEFGDSVRWLGAPNAAGRLLGYSTWAARNTAAPRLRHDLSPLSCHPLAYWHIGSCLQLPLKQ